MATPESTPPSTPPRTTAHPHALRFHTPHVHLAPVFGSDRFGQQAEAFARFFGIPTFLLAQTGAADYSSEEGGLAGAALSLRWAMIPYRQVGSATTARSQYSRATPGFLSRSAATFPSL